MSGSDRLRAVASFSVRALNGGWDGLTEARMSTWICAAAQVAFDVVVRPVTQLSALRDALPAHVHAEIEPPPDADGPDAVAYVGMSADRDFPRRYLTLVGGSRSGESFLKVDLLRLPSDDSPGPLREGLCQLFFEVAGVFSQGELKECWYDPLAQRGGGITGLSKYRPTPGQADVQWLRSRARPAWATLLRSEQLALMSAQVDAASHVEISGRGWAVLRAPFSPASRRYEDWDGWCRFLAAVAGPIDLDRARRDGVLND